MNAAQKITINSTITPAYGRDYRNAKFAKKDFLAGKDFYLVPLRVPCSIADFEPGVTIKIRFKGATRCTLIRVGEATNV